MNEQELRLEILLTLITARHYASPERLMRETETLADFVIGQDEDKVATFEVVK
jgi:hypothetical protein